MNDDAVDRAPLEELVKFFGAARAADMIARVAQTLDARFAELQAAALQGGGDVAALAHKIRGLAATYGLKAVSAQILRIETESLTGEALLRSLGALELILGDARTRLEAYVSELRKAAS